MTYRAPLKDMLFVMNELADLDAVSKLPGFEDATPETAQAVGAVPVNALSEGQF